MVQKGCMRGAQGWKKGCARETQGGGGIEKSKKRKGQPERQRQRQAHEMASILQSLESQLSDLLWQIAEDYGLDHGELCERYLGSVVTPKVRATKSAKGKGVEKKKCCGKTVKGGACKKNALDGSDYCKTHMPKEELEEECESGGETDGPKICCGKTSKGKPCKKRAASGSDYCKTHGPKESEEEEGEDEEEVVMCKAVTGKKQPCKKKATCDGYCNTHKKGPFKLKEPAHTHEPGEEDDDCASCSLYGDPVNGAKSAMKIIEDEASTSRKHKRWADETEEEAEEAPQPRRSERIRLAKLLEHVEQEKMDGDEEDEEEAMEDLLSFAKELESQMEEEEF